MRSNTGLRGELLADLLAGRAALPEEPGTGGTTGPRSHAATHRHGGRAEHTGRQSEPRLYERALSSVAKLAADHQPRPLVAMHAGHVVVLWPRRGTSQLRGQRCCALCSSPCPARR